MKSTHFFSATKNSALLLSMLIALSAPAILSAQIPNAAIKNCPHEGAACIRTVAEQNSNRVLNGDSALGETYHASKCGLNYVQGSVLIQTRSVFQGFNTTGSGLPSSISIAGLPPTFIVDKAYLTFGSSYTDSTIPSVNLSFINPLTDTSAYEPVLIGVDGEKCWNEKGTAVYRSDVSSSISGNGVYSFDITGFFSPSGEIDGATLLIIYRDTAASYQGTLIYWDGAMTSGNFNGAPALSITMNGFSACGNSTYANAFMNIADMQMGINGGTHITTLNGDPDIYLNNFWNFDVASTHVTAGQDSSFFMASGGGLDCYMITDIGLYFQTTTCTFCAVGIDEIESRFYNLTLSPNPITQNNFQLSYSLLQSTEIKITMMSVEGKEIITWQRNMQINGEHKETFSLPASIANGIYFLKITSDDAASQVVKMVLSR